MTASFFASLPQYFDSASKFHSQSSPRSHDPLDQGNKAEHKQDRRVEENDACGESDEEPDSGSYHHQNSGSDAALRIKRFAELWNHWRQVGTVFGEFRHGGQTFVFAVYKENLSGTTLLLKCAEPPLKITGVSVC